MNRYLDSVCEVPVGVMQKLGDNSASMATVAAVAASSAFTSTSCSIHYCISSYVVDKKCLSAKCATFNLFSLQCLQDTIVITVLADFFY